MKTSSLLTGSEFNQDKPVVSLLFETDNTKELKIVMSTNSIMKEHKTPYPIVVELFEGEINFGVNNEVYHLKKGDILALDGGVPHDLVCTANAIIRLSLSKNDAIERVKNVAKNL
ncbi:MAG: cupin [Bacteroidetes bacterium MedPE-SWsnd-G2]|nr:MAG: cupin [Bacteroidetes bacterium MedPE-SWsnd-G2]